MMKVRSIQGKFVFILFFCFTVLSTLEAAPHHSTDYVVALSMLNVDECDAYTVAPTLPANINPKLLILDLTAKTLSGSGQCVEVNGGNTVNFSFSTTYTQVGSNISGTLDQTVDGNSSNILFEGNIIEPAIGVFRIALNGLPANPFNITAIFKTSVEPIPTLSQWNIMLLIFLLSVTVYFKGIKQS